MKRIWLKGIVILVAHALLFVSWHLAPWSSRPLMDVFPGLSTFLLTSGMMPIYLYALVASVPIIIDVLIFGALSIYSRKATNVSLGRTGVFVASALTSAGVLAASLWSIHGSLGTLRGSEAEVNTQMAFSIGVAALLAVWLVREFLRARSENRPLRSEFLENYGFAIYFYFFLFGIKMGFLA